MPFVRRTALQVEVNEVPGETNLANNTAEYLVIFSYPGGIVDESLTTFVEEAAARAAAEAKVGGLARTGHGALDGFLLLRREGDRRSAVVELLHVDPRIVAPGSR